MSVIEVLHPSCTSGTTSRPTRNTGNTASACRRGRLAGLLAALFTVGLVGCATNPVTGQSELRLVSEAQEVAIGEEQYSPSRQMQGGDYLTHPQIQAYVKEVGQRVAAQSERKLPYEFTVLNNSVPNAWALPGGKIAVNRGLLTELQSEAELAAVLGHEVVHAAARHGARSMERNIMMQGVMVGLLVTMDDKRYAPLVVGGAQVGAQLITQKYGRDAERESDYYGMQYMARAGYNPYAAVDLQETFVRLSSDQPDSSWLDGLLASHPPSAERVENNRRTAAELGDQGDYGRERYAKMLAPLREDAPAYANYERALQSLQSGDLAGARALASEAVALQPREALFHGLLGDIEAGRGDPQAADAAYQRALALNPGYFQFHLNRGRLQASQGNTAAAEASLARSASLLPTAPAYGLLGQLAADAGRDEEAVRYLSAAADSRSTEGQQAAALLARLDLPRNPTRYLPADVRPGRDGLAYVVVENRSAITVSTLQLELILLSEDGRQVSGRRSLSSTEPLEPGQKAVIATGVSLQNPSTLPRLRARVFSATP
jgi:predicted Zn-dependent protease